MNEDLEALRHETLHRIEDLETESAGIAESTADHPDDEHDAEGSTVGYERARVSALLELAREQLASLEQAIDRRTSGRYGICSLCGEPIGSDRLEALPATKLCIGCAKNP